VPDLLVDLGPVVALLALGVVLGKGERSNDVGAAVVVTLPLLLRRRWPLPVLAMVAFVATVTSTQVREPWVQVGAVLVASFSAGSESRDRTPAALVVLLVASLMAIGFLAQDVDLAQSCRPGSSVTSSGPGGSRTSPGPTTQHESSGSRSSGCWRP
jgi:hypothetical protein